MDKGIYTALSGGIAKSHELDIVANNLANVNTPGFKRDQGTFNEYLMELRHPDSVEGLKREITAQTMMDGRPPGDKSFVEMDGVYTNFQQGPLQSTGRPLDLGLQGNGFFEVLSPSGIRYTRQGNFNVSAEGRLVTVNGYPVLGIARELPDKTKTLEVSTEGRHISSTDPTGQGTTKKDVPPEGRFIQLGSGPVRITGEGAIWQNGAQIATLSVEEFKEPQWLEKVGNSYYRNDNADNFKSENAETTVNQGFLEGSNVNPIREMTKLIEVTRSYESHMQAIKTYQEIDGRTVNDIAQSR